MNIRSSLASALLLVICFGDTTALLADDYVSKPGDYGYHHDTYHYLGTVDELKKLTGKNCCDNMGECRATTVNISKRMALLDGLWCPLGNAPVRTDVELPDAYAMVCAGVSEYEDGRSQSCPRVYCVALPESY